MDKIIRLGVIGVGMVSQIAHLPALSKIKGIKLVALADHNEILARSVATKFGFQRVYYNHHDLLADSEIDAVIVVVHRHDTAAVVSDALRAGKHVLTEKPMSPTLEIAVELYHLAKQKGLILAVGFMRRHDLGVHRAKVILNQSRDLNLGEVVSVRFRNYCKAYVGYCEDYMPRPEKKQRFRNAIIAPTWLPSDLRGQYDWFINVASHSINLIQYFFTSDLKVIHADFSRSLSALVVFDANGTQIILDAGKAATGRWDEGIEIYFERGRMEIEFTSLMQRDRCATITLDTNTGSHKRQIENPVGPWSFALQAKNFIETLMDSTPLLTNSDDGLRGIEIIEMCWKNYLHNYDN